jgi:hypothetical protein
LDLRRPALTHAAFGAGKRRVKLNADRARRSIAEYALSRVHRGHPVVGTAPKVHANVYLDPMVVIELEPLGQSLAEILTHVAHCVHSRKAWDDMFIIDKNEVA